jgi:hypothetical protein
MHVYVLRLQYMLDTTLFCISIISQKITYSLEFIFSSLPVHCTGLRLVYI